MQMCCERGAITRSACMGLVVQQRFEIARVGELAQCGAQQLGLPGDDGAVEGEVGVLGGLRGVVHSKAERKRQVFHESAAPGLAAH